MTEKTLEAQLDEAIENGDLMLIKKLREQIKSNTNRKTMGNGVKFVQNQFDPKLFDDLAEVKDAKKFDKKNKIKRAPRTRRGAVLIDVVCIKCKQKYQVAPILAREHFICDGCITK